MLSKMIAELIADHDSVALPGVGSFIASVVPASFSDRGFSIHPPYRKLSFVSYDIGDQLLIDLYARNNSVNKQDAKEILADYLKDLKIALETRKSVSLPGLGRLRATKDNDFFFVPDENLDIYPEGYGLEAVSLRNKVPEEVDDFDDGLGTFATPFDLEDIDDPEPTPAEPEEIAKTEPEQEPAEPELEPDSEPVEPTEPETPGSRKRCRRWIWLLAIVLFAALAFGSFLLLSHVNPELIDSILYTPEELQIINY